MPKKPFILIPLTVAIIASSIWLFSVFTSSNDQAVNNSDKTIKLPNLQTIELADEPQEHSQGLMHREELCDSCAMLFVFQESASRSFWMKNTLIPLDIIFIDSNYQIQKIHSNTTPLQTRPSYPSNSPIKYVLEANAFWAKENNINEGDYIAVDYLIDISEPYQQIIQK